MIPLKAVSQKEIEKVLKVSLQTVPKTNLIVFI